MSRHVTKAAMTLVVLLSFATLAGACNQQVSQDIPKVSIAPETVTSIKVESSGETIELELKGADWVMTKPLEAPVSPAPVKNLLSRFEDLEIASIISDNPASYQEFGVGDNGNKVTFKTGRKTRSFVVAGQSETYQSDYFRIIGDKRVFYLKRRLIVMNTPSEWRDKQVIAIEPSSIKKASISGDEGSVELTRTDTGWSFTDGKRANSVAVDKWLASYSRLLADGFVDDFSAKDIAEHAMRVVSFELEDGTRKVIRFAEQGSDIGHAVNVDGSANVFDVSQARLQFLAPDRSVLRDS